MSTTTCATMVFFGSARLDGLSPAHDLNPVPTDLKARVLTTNIKLDEGTCSLDLLEATSECFGLTLQQARANIKEVAIVTATWRETAKVAGARAMTRTFIYSFTSKSVDPSPGATIALHVTEIEDAGIREVLQASGRAQPMAHAQT